MKPERRRWKIALAAVPILMVLAAGAAGMYSGVRSGLEQQRAAIEAGWSDVDAALRERGALIRDLAETGSGPGLNGTPAREYLRKEVAGAYADLVKGTTPEARIRAHERLSGSLARLLIAGESASRDKPDRRLAHLQEQIKDSDERVAVARRKYNELLEHYNARIQTFPNNLVARIAGFQRNDAYFKTEPF